ncbi:MAG: hypothetical protein JSS14_22130 [Proteobacteria bacterium]|nr:hypothetical protein [Pseudomonadota bacterium]
MHHKRLVKHISGAEGYACTFYETAMVTYYEDGIAVCCDERMSSRLFLNCVLPNELHSFAHKNATWLQLGDKFYTGLKVQFDLVDGRAVYACGAQEHVIEVTDLKKAAQVRKQLKPFMEWHRAVSRLAPQREGVWSTPVTYIAAAKDLLDGAGLEHFDKIRTHVADHKELLKHAYQVSGARTSQPIPIGKLP